MALVNSISELVGETPLLALRHLDAGLPGRVFAKLEYLNPAGSVKDRVALQMILDAEEKGVLPHGGTIIEPTSGNTGIGLAAMGVSRGYRVVLTMPDTMSVERRSLLAAYGAELVLTGGAKGMAGAIEKAEELQREIPGSIIAGQFDNPANPAAHYASTGPEIWRDMGGKVDILVAGVGTGGTLSGTGRYLKEKNPNLEVVAVEPARSPILSGGAAGPHGLQGIGANFVPANLDRELCSRIVTVTEEDAYGAARRLAREEGVLVGISSGAALWAALETAKSAPGKRIVVILPDTGDRYLSTPLFAQ